MKFEAFYSEHGPYSMKFAEKREARVESIEKTGTTFLVFPKDGQLTQVMVSETKNLRALHEALGKAVEQSERWDREHGVA